MSVCEKKETERKEGLLVNAAKEGINTTLYAIVPLWYNRSSADVLLRISGLFKLRICPQTHSVIGPFEVRTVLYVQNKSGCL